MGRIQVQEGRIPSAQLPRTLNIVVVNVHGVCTCVDHELSRYLLHLYRLAENISDIKSLVNSNI